ncbi:hypothetical protein LguiA_025564 [Lonicera macranthoides]
MCKLQNYPKLSGKFYLRASTLEDAFLDSQLMDQVPLWSILPLWPLKLTEISLPYDL